MTTRPARATSSPAGGQAGGETAGGKAAGGKAAGGKAAAGKAAAGGAAGGAAAGGEAASGGPASGAQDSDGPAAGETASGGAPSSGPTGGKPAGAKTGAGRASAGRKPAGLRATWLAGGFVAVAVALVAGIAFGPVTLPPGGVAAELLNLIPGVRLHSGLTEREVAIVTALRLPRVVLGLLVGAMLALAGAAYQGVFRNPLADPHLLGVAAGAGLGVTAVIAARSGTGDVTADLPLGVPLAAFVGAVGAVILTWLLGAAGGRARTPATLILSGVAVSAFLAAAQTFVMQRHTDSLREVYAWLLGRLATAGWHDVLIVLPYAAVTGIIVLAHRRELDVLTVGDEEAAALGLHPQRSRYLLVVAASLGTAAAVSVSGLIGFVGIIVPHTLRLLAGPSYRSILPLSVLFGGAFLALTDLVARTVASPAEIPIGVVTAFFGAPFFAVVLRRIKG